MGRMCVSSTGKMIKIGSEFFCLKPLWMRSRQTSELRQEDNIKMGLRQTGCEYVNRIKVTQDRP
jgi:hypothetical protein